MQMSLWVFSSHDRWIGFTPKRLGFWKGNGTPYFKNTGFHTCDGWLFGISEPSTVWLQQTDETSPSWLGPNDPKYTVVKVDGASPKWWRIVSGYDKPMGVAPSILSRWSNDKLHITRMVYQKNMWEVP